MRRSLLFNALIIAASISALVVVLQHRSSSTRCSLDGSRIDPSYEVIIIGENETSYSLSCVLSAQIWLMGNSEGTSSIWVTDEVTGEKIRAELAYYVESDVITTPHTGNRIHVFAQDKAAKSHARQYKGKFVRNPLGVLQQRPVKLVEYIPHSPDSTGFILTSFQKLLYLSSMPAFIRCRKYAVISQKQFSHLCRGYARPPDRPPKPSI